MKLKNAEDCIVKCSMSRSGVASRETLYNIEENSVAILGGGAIQYSLTDDLNLSKKR